MAPILTGIKRWTPGTTPTEELSPEQKSLPINAPVLRGNPTHRRNMISKVKTILSILSKGVPAPNCQYFQAKGQTQGACKLVRVPSWQLRKVTCIFSQILHPVFFGQWNFSYYDRTVPIISPHRPHPEATSIAGDYISKFIWHRKGSSWGSSDLGWSPVTGHHPLRLKW